MVRDGDAARDSNPDPLISRRGWSPLVDDERNLLLARDSGVGSCTSVLIAHHPLALIEVRKEVCGGYGRPCGHRDEIRRCRRGRGRTPRRRVVRWRRWGPVRPVRSLASARPGRRGWCRDLRPGRDRRHFPSGVLGQYRDELIDVRGFEGTDVSVEQGPLSWLGWSASRAGRVVRPATRSGPSLHSWVRLVLVGVEGLLRGGGSSGSRLDAGAVCCCE
jgi:hypothetical protein